MTTKPPPGWQNPIGPPAGRTVTGVDPALLLPSRADLDGARLALQRQLLTTGTPRFTPIQVTPDGVIWDGHHAVRVAAEAGLTVEVRVVPASVSWSGLTILQLPVR